MSLTGMGRLLGVANVLAMPIIGAWQFFPPNSKGALAVYCFLAGLFLGVVEVPSLCSCARVCRGTAKYTKVVTGYWVGRALAHWAAAAGGYAIWATLSSEDHSWIIMGCLIGSTLTGLLYLVGRLYKGEEDPNPIDLGWRKAAGSGEGTSGSSEGKAAFGGGEAREAATGFFGRLLARNSGAIAKAAVDGATAPSTGQSLFGGGGSSPGGERGDSSSASASGGDKDRGSLFSGGSLFGGASSSASSSSAPAPAAAPSAAAVAAASKDKAAKYGMSGDDAEEGANPFLS